MGMRASLTTKHSAINAVKQVNQLNTRLPIVKLIVVCNKQTNMLYGVVVNFKFQHISEVLVFPTVNKNCHIRWWGIILSSKLWSDSSSRVMAISLYSWTNVGSRHLWKPETQWSLIFVFACIFFLCLFVFKCCIYVCVYCVCFS